jgi:hypothetical protein
MLLGNGYYNRTLPHIQAEVKEQEVEQKKKKKKKEPRQKHLTKHTHETAPFPSILQALVTQSGYPPASSFPFINPHYYTYWGIKH